LFAAILTAISSADFVPVDLGSLPNWNNYFINLPTGNVQFDSIPFFVRDYDPAFIVTEGGLPGAPADVYISQEIDEVTAVHLLLNGGSMYNYLFGVEIGHLTFVGSGFTRVVSLVGGVNIREWSPAYPDQVINTLSDPNAREVWSGMWSGWTTVPARVDLYTVFLPSDFGSLQSIQIHDTNGSPSINCYGLTVEVVPEPATIAILGLGALALIRRRR